MAYNLGYTSDITNDDIKITTLPLDFWIAEGKSGTSHWFDLQQLQFLYFQNCTTFYLGFKH